MDAKVVGDAMDVVEIDDGLVEMSKASTTVIDVKRVQTKQRAEKERSMHQINLESDSEEEEVAIVSADHL